MNKINFTAKNKFPQSTVTMDMVQQMINLSAATAQTGGSNYILSGCEDDGTGHVGAGVIVINGELLPFQGGAKGNKITIVETSKTLTARGEDFPEAYVYRVAGFSASGEYDWSDFPRVTTNRQLSDRFDSLKSEEPGFVKMWSGRIDRIPGDYRLCNGDIVTTAQYPGLAYSLGHETEEYFSLPDLRRRFIAGYDSAAEGYGMIGATGGLETVTLTESQMPKHTHDIAFADARWGDDANSRPFPNPAGTSGYKAETASAGSGNAHENRPPYYVLAYVIKVK